MELIYAEEIISRTPYMSRASSNTRVITISEWAVAWEADSGVICENDAPTKEEAWRGNENTLAVSLPVLLFPNGSVCLQYYSLENSLKGKQTTNRVSTNATWPCFDISYHITLKFSCILLNDFVLCDFSTPSKAFPATMYQKATKKRKNRVPL